MDSLSAPRNTKSGSIAERGLDLFAQGRAFITIVLFVPLADLNIELREAFGGWALPQSSSTILPIRWPPQLAEHDRRFIFFSICGVWFCLRSETGNQRALRKPFAGLGSYPHRLPILLYTSCGSWRFAGFGRVSVRLCREKPKVEAGSRGISGYGSLSEFFVSPVVAVWLSEVPKKKKP